MQPAGVETGAGVLRASARISAITLVARLAGFARWIVLGYAVGATYLGNAYQTANWVPNVVFELAAGGLLAAVLVPTLVAEAAGGRERAETVASGLLNLFLLASVPLVVIGIALAEPIMRAFTIGVADPEVRRRQVELGAWFLRFFAPQIPLYVLATVWTGLLHAHKRFALPAAAPLFSSLVVIATYLTFASLGARSEVQTVSRTQLWVLGAGTTAGVFALAFGQLPGVLRLGLHWRPVLGWRDPAVRRALRAGGYGMAYFGLTQVGWVTALVLLNRVRGGVVAYQIGMAFFELPHALIGLPIATALVPSLAERVVAGDERGFARLLSQGWRTAAFLLIPAAVGAFAIAGPLAHGLFGSTSLATPGLTAGALRGLALGLPAYSLAFVLTRAFYARHDTRPPVATNAVAMSTMAATAVALTVVLAPRGASALTVIGASHAFGQWLALGVAVWLLVRRSAWRPLGRRAAGAGP